MAHQIVKNLAYTLDPEAWVSYSGKPVEYKRQMESRRNFSIQTAEKMIPADSLSELETIEDRIDHVKTFDDVRAILRELAARL